MSDSSSEASATTHRMAVGLDGSPGAVTALEWALATDPGWGAITPVSVWSPNRLEQVLVGAAAPVAHDDHERAVEAAIEATIRRATSDPSDRERLTDPLVVEGKTVPTLMDATAEFDLLVVGTRSRSAVADAILGSTSIDCVARATIPIAVVPDTTATTGGPVVVGVDGSKLSEDALTWTLEHVRDDVPVLALGAWPLAPYGRWQGATAERDQGVAEAMATRVCERLGVAVDRVEVRVERGDPRNVLDSAAQDARMLVIGARGEPSWPKLLIGSVASALLHRPTCPTVVLPSR